ncbi:tRNA (guanosine(46)-N7)-methyltransferase TrmB [bacterium]|nr:MAG: tRNA (guanosine(46)-N7)-methyltransferase TrmB [bacterium]
MEGIKPAIRPLMESLLSIDWKNETFPLDLKKIFGEGAVRVEIGFGNGEFLVYLAKKYPDDYLLGIEYSWVSMRKAEKRLKKEGIENVKLVRVSAEVAFDLLIPERSIKEVWLNFPDPWPKKRHTKRRLLNREFQKYLAASLEDGGEVHLLTDHEGYFEFVKEEVNEGGVFCMEEKEPPSWHPGTKYWRKWEEMGKKIHYLRMVKKAHPEVKRMIKPCEVEPVITRLDLHSMRDVLIREDEVIVKIFKVDGDKLVVYLKEGPLFEKAYLPLEETQEGIKVGIPENVFRGRALKKLMEVLNGKDSIPSTPSR